MNTKLINLSTFILTALLAGQVLALPVKETQSSPVVKARKDVSPDYCKLAGKSDKCITEHHWGGGTSSISVSIESPTVNRLIGDGAFLGYEHLYHGGSNNILIPLGSTFDFECQWDTRSSPKVSVGFPSHYRLVGDMPSSQYHSYDIDPSKLHEHENGFFTGKRPIELNDGTLSETRIYTQYDADKRSLSVKVTDFDAVASGMFFECMGGKKPLGYWLQFAAVDYLDGPQTPTVTQRHTVTFNNTFSMPFDNLVFPTVTPLSQLLISWQHVMGNLGIRDERERQYEIELSVDRGHSFIKQGSVKENRVAVDVINDGSPFSLRSRTDNPVLIAQDKASETALALTDDDSACFDIILRVTAVNAIGRGGSSDVAFTVERTFPRDARIGPIQRIAPDHNSWLVNFPLDFSKTQHLETTVDGQKISQYFADGSTLELTMFDEETHQLAVSYEFREKYCRHYPLSDNGGKNEEALEIDIDVISTGSDTEQLPQDIDDEAKLRFLRRLRAVFDHGSSTYLSKSDSARDSNLEQVREAMAAAMTLYSDTEEERDPR